MSIKYFIDESFIPDDGSNSVIQKYSVKLPEKDNEIIIFPDIHYKKGSRVVNGMVISSTDSIFPSMLGVANCGFTFGKICNVKYEDSEKIDEILNIISQKFLKNIRQDINSICVFDEMLKYAMNNTSFYENEVFRFLGIRNEEQLSKSFKEVFTNRMIDEAAMSLGSLGGGNHFFELHYIVDIFDKSIGLEKGDIIYVLHSDSINVGNTINLLFSNLSELWSNKGMHRFKSKLKYRLQQFEYFVLKNKVIFREPIILFNLILSHNDYRRINYKSMIGRLLLLAYSFASIFGDINRVKIIKEFENILENVMPRINLEQLGNHSHDDIKILEIDGKNKIVHFNGVQFLGRDKLFVLPGAISTESYIMHNSYNKDAYYSANHGVGRIYDKHIAREKFSNENTYNQISKNGTIICKIGNSIISEQNPNAFKDINEVVDLMERHNLGKKAARLKPIISFKG